MHKKPLYAIMISSTRGVKKYEFHNYKVMDQGVALIKRDFPIDFVQHEKMMTPIANPTGVYIFGYSLPEVSELARDWFKRHVEGIDEDITRLQSIRNMLCLHYDKVMGGQDDVEQTTITKRMPSDFTVYLVSDACRYFALIVNTATGLKSNITSASKSSARAIWDALVCALRHIQDNTELQSICLHTEDPEMQVKINMLADAEVIIPRASIPTECVEPLRECIRHFLIVAEDIDRKSDLYKQCMEAVHMWQ